MKLSTFLVKNSPWRKNFTTSSFPLVRVLPGIVLISSHQLINRNNFNNFRHAICASGIFTPPEVKTQPKSCSLSLSREAWSLLVDRFKASSSVLESGSLCTISPQKQGIYHKNPSKNVALGGPMVFFHPPGKLTGNLKMGEKPPIFKGDSDLWKTISSWFDALVFLAGVYAYHIDILSLD